MLNAGPDGGEGAGLLKNAGYWAGFGTAKKPDYDTFENCDLVSMNARLLNEVGYNERFDRVFRREQIDQIIERAADVRLEPYQQFIQECNLHCLPKGGKKPSCQMQRGIWTCFAC